MIGSFFIIKKTKLCFIFLRNVMTTENAFSPKMRFTALPKST